MALLNLTENDIKNCSRTSLKGKVRNAISNIALKNLLEKAKPHSKAREDLYTYLKGMKLMRDPGFTTNDVNTLSKLKNKDV